jgi:hypothetical protein
MLGTVGPPYWDDRPVALVGGGPSLVGFDLERLRPLHVVGVKASMFDIPWADAGFGLDTLTFKEWRERFAALSFPVFWAIPEHDLIGKQPQAPNVVLLKRTGRFELSRDPAVINGGGTSGYGALELALHKRANKIVLLGYDYSIPASGDFHHNERHYVEKRAQSPSAWKMWTKNFDKAARELPSGVEVINASPHSQIAGFPRTAIEDGLQRCGC